jgi:hypothetical protein
VENFGWAESISESIPGMNETLCLSCRTAWLALEPGLIECCEWCPQEPWGYVFVAPENDS